MVLDCKSSGCTLTINTPKKFAARNSSSQRNTKRKTRIEFSRDQLVRSDNILWDPSSERIVENYGLSSPSYDGSRTDEEEEDFEQQDRKGRPNKPWNKHKKKKKQQRKKKNKSYAAKMFGPDENGYYASYTLVLRDPTPDLNDGENEEETSPSMKMAARHKAMLHDPNSVAAQLAPFALRSSGDEMDSLEYNLHLRDFNIGQTRRLPRTAVAKINSYAKGRRSSFAIREARPVSWQGLTLLILGIFSLVLCLLLGQFWEEYDATKDGSYRKRMAEIKRRKEAELQRRKKVGTRQPARSGYNGSNVRLRTGASSGAESRGTSGVGYGAAKRGY